MNLTAGQRNPTWRKRFQTPRASPQQLNDALHYACDLAELWERNPSFPVYVLIEPLQTNIIQLRPFRENVRLSRQISLIAKINWPRFYLFGRSNQSWIEAIIIAIQVGFGDVLNFRLDGAGRFNTFMYFTFFRLSPESTHQYILCIWTCETFRCHPWKLPQASFHTGWMPCRNRKIGEARLLFGNQAERSSMNIRTLEHRAISIAKLLFDLSSWEIPREKKNQKVKGTSKPFVTPIGLNWSHCLF